MILIIINTSFKKYGISILTLCNNKQLKCLYIYITKLVTFDFFRNNKNEFQIYIKHNRCTITGRSHGFYSFFGLSRHVLRFMASYGFLPGVTKSSW